MTLLFNGLSARRRASPPFRKTAIAPTEKLRPAASSSRRLRQTIRSNMSGRSKRRSGKLWRRSS